MMMKQCDAGDSANQALGASMQAIANAGDALHSEASRLIQVLGLSPDSNPILSNVTFTR
jgi:hypothetical protein